MCKFWSLPAILLCMEFTTFGQNGLRNFGSDDPYESKTCGLFGINYVSDNVYLGRKDTITIPYFSPYLGFRHSSGWYAKAMVSYTTAGIGGHVDLTTLETGYDHTFGKNLVFGLNAERYFYNRNSVNIRANMKGSLEMDAQLSNHWLEPSVLCDLNFNKNSPDIATGFSLDHDVELDKGRLSIYPAIAAFSGTRNYYDEYLVNKLTKKDKSLKLSHAVANAARFNLLTYEFSCQTTFRANRWLFVCKPTYAAPLNAATIVLPKQTIHETTSNTFFVEIDICYRG